MNSHLNALVLLNCQQLLAHVISCGFDKYRLLVSSAPFPNVTQINELLHDIFSAGKNVNAELQAQVQCMKDALIITNPDFDFWTPDLLGVIDGIAKTHFEKCKELLGMGQEDDYMNALLKYVADVDALLKSKRANHSNIDAIRGRWNWVMAKTQSNVTPFPLITETVYLYLCNNLKRFALSLDAVSPFPSH